MKGILCLVAALIFATGVFAKDNDTSFVVTCVNTAFGNNGKGYAYQVSVISTEATLEVRSVGLFHNMIIYMGDVLSDEVANVALTPKGDFIISSNNFLLNFEHDDFGGKGTLLKSQQQIVSNGNLTCRKGTTEENTH
jgi:hypothetical protein